MYALDDGSFLLDDTSVDYGSLPGSPPPTPLDGPKSFTNGLWLEITSISNGVANVILHGTTASDPYTLLSKTALTTSQDWAVEQYLTGATNQDRTPTKVPMLGQPNLFLWACSGTVPGQPVFWLEIVGISNGVVNLVIHGTLADVSYEVQDKQSIRETNWVTEITVAGLDNATPVAIPMANRPSLFFQVLSWVDSNETGIPDWWWLKYFGPNWVAWADPLADPDGDGWSNIQEYQNRTNPKVFDTPPPPQNVAARLEASGTQVVLTWVSGGGLVLEYGIEHPYIGEVARVGASTLTFTNSFCYSLIGSIPLPQYQIRAYYTNGMNTVSATVAPQQNDLGADMLRVRGSSGQQYLILASPPPGLARIRISWDPGNLDVCDDFPGFDIAAASLVNGIAQLPPDQLALAGDAWLLAEVVSDKGQVGAPNLLGSPDYYQALPNNFINASAHMKENLKFLLRAATPASPFRYTSNLRPYNSPYPTALSAYMSSPEDHYARPPSPEAYEYYGFHTFSQHLGYSFMDVWRPIQDNYLWRNFVYEDSDFDLSGCLVSGAGPATDDLTTPALYDPVTYASPDQPTNVPPVALSNAVFTWLPADYVSLDWNPMSQTYVPNVGYIGLQSSLAADVSVPVGVSNVWGLPIDSAVLHGECTNDVGTIFAGGASKRLDTVAFAYPHTPLPDLHTVDYYFASEGYANAFGTLPGSPTFTVTNRSRLLVTGIGQPITVSGWAKQVISNGCAGKFAYLEQYFDLAYTIAANGAATTNSAGQLSPYGTFAPTQPGPAALVTRADIETGQPGTGVVNVIKVQLDVNHDGTMDLSLSGPDNTSSTRPFVFWLNNDFDRLAPDDADHTNYEDSVESAVNPGTKSQQPDCNYTNALGARTIPTKRDLEDYARLWVAGVANWLQDAPGASVSLSWTDAGYGYQGNPTIDLFEAFDPDGGTGYLTNETMAAEQLGTPYVARLGPGQRIELSSDNLLTSEHFIFCGVAAGSGTLTLTISDAHSNILAQTSAWIQLQDIKQMYERWTLGDEPSRAPTSAAQLAPDGLPSPFGYPPAIDTNTTYILLVHGWNLKVWEKHCFAERAFKRLYWQGYQGRFGLFRWPTGSGFGAVGDSWRNPLTAPHNYDRSELAAWKSAAGLLNKLNDLNAEYPGHVYMLAVSMGNVVAGEALRLAGNNQIVNTYIASQGAIPAHVYDSSVTNLIDYTHKAPSSPLPAPGHPKTPNIYGDRLAGNSAAVARRINFFNPNDYALSPDVWCYDQELKPDTFPGGYYRYTGATNDPAPWNNFQFVFFGETPPSSLDIVSNLQQRYEVFAYAANPYSRALGSTPGVSNLVNLNLTTVWPPDSSGHNYADHFWHSAQFRGDCWQEWNYWDTLLHSDTAGFDINTP